MTEQRPEKNQRAGKWRFEKALDEGGQGAVWRVRYVADPHSPPGALKLCLTRSEKAVARFEREIELLRAQDHPGIVRVRDVGDFDGRPYFVMDLATTTLAHVARADSTGTRLLLESRELLFRLFRQACEAVAHLHHANVIHRDIKPSNILLMLDPPEPIRAVLADLGVSANNDDQGNLTATHETLGTPLFRAPEALAGNHSPRSDVYSLGKTIEAVINRAPPAEIGPGRCLRDQRLTDNLWDALDSVLARACAFDPAQRYEDAGVLLKALPRVVLGFDSAEQPDVVAQRPSTISLSVAERVALSDVVAECPAVSMLADLYEVRRKTLISEYAFALAIRRLSAIGFLETSIELDEYDNRRTFISPTNFGIKWAHEHHDDVLAAIAEVSPKPSFDDDIPF